jgi:hypothetical protein
MASRVNRCQALQLQPAQLDIALTAQMQKRDLTVIADTYDPVRTLRFVVFGMGMGPIIGAFNDRQGWVLNTIDADGTQTGRSRALLSRSS